VLAEPLDTFVHGMPQFGFVVCDLGVAELARPTGPGFLRHRHQRSDDQAQPLMQHARDAARVSEGVGVDRGPGHLTGVQPGHLGGPQVPP
jgi:hypothetical protein